MSNPYQPPSAPPALPPPLPGDGGLGMRLLLPVGRSGWAIAAGYLGLLSPLSLPAPFAIAAGIICPLPTI